MRKGAKALSAINSILKIFLSPMQAFAYAWLSGWANGNLWCKGEWETQGGGYFFFLPILFHFPKPVVPTTTAWGDRRVRGYWVGKLAESLVSHGYSGQRVADLSPLTQRWFLDWWFTAHVWEPWEKPRSGKERMARDWPTWDGAAWGSTGPLSQPADPTTAGESKT